MENILGIAYYEYRLHWRGISLRVLALTTLLVTCVGLLIWNSLPEGQFARVFNVEGGISTSVVQTFLTFPALICVVVFIFPVAASECIPVDKHHRTIELIDSLPVTPVEYLAGKLLGYWLAGLMIILVAALINGGLWWLTLPGYDIIRYGELWFVAALVFMINSGIGILLGGTQPNRIRAAALVICVLIAATVLLAGADDARQPTSVLSFANPAHLSLIVAYIDPGMSDGLHLTSANVSLSLLGGLIEVAMLFAGLLLLRRRQ